MRNGCLHPGGREMTDRLLQMASFPTGAHVLELGCGNGQTTLLLQQLGYHAIGIDRKAISEASHVQEGDMLHLAFPKESFDVVVAECSMSASGDVPAALEQAYRVLKPGGHLLISDVFFPETDGKQGELWARMIQQAGFCMIELEDVSSVAKRYFFQIIWEEGGLPEKWKKIAAGRKEVGYFLIHGRK